MTAIALGLRQNLAQSLLLVAIPSGVRVPWESTGCGATPASRWPCGCAAQTTGGIRAAVT